MTRKAFRGLVPAASVLSVAVLLQLVGLGHDHDDERETLVISRLILVSSHEVDRQFVEDTYRAELRHTGRPGSRDFAGVTERLLPQANHEEPGHFLQIIDGEVEFGTVRAGQTVQSRDRLTIRRHARFPLKLESLRWAISARPDLVLSEAWAGLWRFTITSKNAETNTVAAVTRVTDTIGANEPVGFSLLPGFVRCTWSGRDDDDDDIEARCSARALVGACLIQGSAHFKIEREGARLAGRGDLQTISTGACGLTAGNGVEVMDIAGVRLAEQADPEPFSPGVLTKLATEPSFIALLASGSTHSVPGPPTDEEDCERGAWRRFVNPGFRSEHECRAFVEGHEDRRDESRR